MELRLKRVYDDPAPDDGFRVLVDRLWPRGLTKERAALDLWAKEVAPSLGAAQGLACRRGGCVERLRGRLPRRTRGHLERRAPALGAELARHPVVTLLFAAHDPVRTHAVVLREALKADVSIPVEPSRCRRVECSRWRAARARAGVAQRLRRADLPHRRRPVHQVRAAQPGVDLRRRGRATGVGGALPPRCRTCSRSGGDGTHEWIVTRAIAGESAVAPRWIAEPADRGPRGRRRPAGAPRRAAGGGLPVRLGRRLAHRECAGPRHPPARRPARAAAGRPARRLPCGCLLPEHPARRRRPLDRTRRPRRSSAPATAGPTSRSRR